jgi:hypothetical protein
LTHYAVATLEELWVADHRLERRLSYGEAHQERDEIVATSRRDDALVAMCENTMSGALAQCSAANRRIVVEATAQSVTVTIVLREQGCSIVTDPLHFAADLALLQSITATPAVRNVPRDVAALVWRNGSGAVLLHEAIGHPREHGQPEIAWPAWLEMDVRFAQRRASFRDRPLRRMESLTVHQHGAPMSMPDRRIEVLLVDGGNYEPLTGTVRMRIAAADLIEGTEVTRLAPFTLVSTREQIAAELSGAEGESVRYPGVICSREGQEVVVPSAAPTLLTVFR